MPPLVLLKLYDIYGNEIAIVNNLVDAVTQIAKRSVSAPYNVGLGNGNGVNYSGGTFQINYTYLNSNGESVPLDFTSNANWLTVSPSVAAENQPYNHYANVTISANTTNSPDIRNANISFSALNQEYNVNVKEHLWRKMIEQIDLNRDGQISYDEFHKMIIFYFYY